MKSLTIFSSVLVMAFMMVTPVLAAQIRIAETTPRSRLLSQPGRSAASLSKVTGSAHSRPCPEAGRLSMIQIREICSLSRSRGCSLQDWSIYSSRQNRNALISCC